MLDLTRKARRLILVIIDFFILAFALLLSKWLVFGYADISFATLPCYLGLIAVTLFVLFLCSIYRIRVFDSSVELLVRIIVASIICSVIFTILYWVLNDFSLNQIGIRWIVTAFFMIILFLCGYRVFYRILITHRKFVQNEKNRTKTVLVFGAGEIGLSLAQQWQKGKFDYKIVGFIDDDPKLKKVLLKNIPVLGNSDDVEKILKETKADYFIIAITKLSGDVMHKVVMQAKNAGSEILIIQTLFDFKTDSELEEKPISLRKLNIEDLLGRSLIKIDKEPISQMVSDKVVLVTGAGGSIGSEICKQLLSFNPKQLLLLDIDETELHDLSLRLHDYSEEFSQKIFPICCDIKNKKKIDHIFNSFKPEIVFHAAAYKHVPMMEYYPEEAIKTNIMGSYNVLTAACENKVQKVIVISTDKAVNPTNVMGATKRFVELEASLLNNSDTEIVAVRFGNVIGSRGSMLPLFVEQINEGRSITVTHKDIIRYFMAIPEAVSLVFLAGSMAKGGEVMVLDMGEPVKIYDFAKRLVEYYGSDKSKVVVTGLRPGEKLYEELLADKDTTIPTDNEKVFKAKVTGTLKKEQLDDMLSTIESATPDELVEKLESLIPEFHRQNNAPLSYLLK